MSSSVDGRRPRRGRQNRERDIVSTAARIIHTDGFSRLNVDDLARQVGISKSTLYQHYDHKSDIVLHAVQFGVQSILHTLSTTDGSPLDRLEQLLRFLHRYHEDDESALAGVVFTEAMHLLSTDETTQQDVERMLRTIGVVVQEAKENGEIRQEVPEEIVMTSMFSLAVALSSYPIPLSGPSHNDHIDQMLAWWRKCLS